MFSDYHIHTNFSGDSEVPMEAMVQRAIALGMDEIAITDHVDHGLTAIQVCDYEPYFAELARLQDKYKGKLAIKAGIEFGVQLETIPQYELDFAKYPFDFVILSNHQVGGKEYWNNVYQVGKTQEEIHDGYYQGTLEVLQTFKHYSVLGHLDMIKRYDSFGDYPDSKIMPMIEQILRQAIADGKGIELNTSCFKYGLADLTPSRAILELYRDLGGTVITLGSDSHHTANLGEKIMHVRGVLKEIGFKHFCTFDKMQPKYWEL
jgi:histidinol-phosphatase (PHP family)